MSDGKCIRIPFSLTEQQLNKIDWLDQYFMKREKAMATTDEEIASLRTKANRSLIARMAIDSFWDAVVYSIAEERHKMAVEGEQQ